MTNKEYKTYRGGGRKFHKGDTSHLHIQYSAPLAALMRKWHLNSDFTAHSSFYYLQKGPDGTSISKCSLEKYRWRVEMQWKGLFKEMNPLRNWRWTFVKKKGTSERAKDHPVRERSPLFISKRSILGPDWGRVYAELSFFPCILAIFIL